jgi:septal ring factor EnvC (AmiA/AmiB activator)
MEEEIKKAKETILKLEKTLKETQDSLDNLRVSVLKSCDAALNILRGVERK